MTQAAVNNAKVLYGLGVDRKDVVTVQQIFEAAPVLQEILESPVLTIKDKDAVIDKIISEEKLPDIFARYLKVMFRIGCICEIKDIFKAYFLYWDKMNNIVKAEIFFSKEPDDAEYNAALNLLKEKYPDKKIEATKSIDKSLLGGFLIKTNHKEYDRSYEDKLRQIERKLIRR